MPRGSLNPNTPEAGRSHSVRRVGVKSPEHALVPALTLRSAESLLGVKIPEKPSSETSMDLTEAPTLHFDLN